MTEPSKAARELAEKISEHIIREGFTVPLCDGEKLGAANCIDEAVAPLVKMGYAMRYPVTVMCGDETKEQKVRIEAEEWKRACKRCDEALKPWRKGV